ncbi:hypothetical protein ABH894_005402 [Paenibacillus sp. RC62]|uniref:hypothetical protein n=1 Tax=Paenibacillus sp. RC82 TaxID=3156251 RepID=UPI003834929D
MIGQGKSEYGDSVPKGHANRKGKCARAEEAQEDNELIQKVIEDIELFYEAELEG